MASTSSLMPVVDVASMSSISGGVFFEVGGHFDCDCGARFVLSLLIGLGGWCGQESLSSGPGGAMASFQN